MDPAAPTRRHILGTVAGLGVLPLSSPPGQAASPDKGAAAAAELSTTELLINGQRMALALDPGTTPLDAPREQTALSGTKKGCDQGSCGACTVHIDGHRVADSAR